MYKTFFGLQEDPFGLNPDPQYLYLTPGTLDALTRLTYGIENRKGFMLLTGEVGTGKTTLLNRLLAWLNERSIPSAFIFNSRLRTSQLFDFIMSDFRIPCESREKSHVLIRLNQWLLERYRSGKTSVLVVDEAQSLSLQVLEEIRLLTNMETASQKLIQIVLCGQPELEQKLKQPELRQLRQRIVLRCRTNPLSLEETRAYITYRLRIAGSNGESIFSEEAMHAVHRYAHGIPRIVNVLCELALINAFAHQQRPVLATSVDEAASETQVEDLIPTAPLAQTMSDQAQPLESSEEITARTNRQAGADIGADIEDTERSAGSEASTATISQVAVVISTTTAPKPAAAPKPAVEPRFVRPTTIPLPKHEGIPVSLPTAKGLPTREYSASSPVLKADSDAARLPSTPPPAVSRPRRNFSLRQVPYGSKNVALVAGVPITVMGLLAGGLMIGGQVRPNTSVPHQEAIMSAPVTVQSAALQPDPAKHSTTNASVTTATTSSLPRGQSETEPTSVQLPTAKGSVNRDASPRANLVSEVLHAPVLKSSPMRPASEPSPPLIPQSIDLPETALAVELLAGAGSGSAPAPPPSGSTHAAVGGQLQAPKVLSSPPPVYPARARAERIQGTVLMDALVDVTGKVTELTVISGPLLLRDAALAALQTWTYQPARLNGQPVAVHTRVNLNFELN